MFEGNDKELYNYTMKIMESITSSYTDGGMHKDAKKLIEKAVATRIAAIMPSKYTEAEITVAEVYENLYVTATYSIDGDAEVVAIYKETITEDTGAMMKAPMELGTSSRGTTEDFVFPNFGRGRGSKVETLPGGKGIDELSDLEYFQERMWKGLKLPKSIFAQGLKKTMNPPYTTERFVAAEATEKAREKPTIDFKSISQLSAPSSDVLPRYEAGVHVGIDLAKVNVHQQEAVDNMANEIRKEIDKDIINNLMAVSTALHTPPDEALTLEKLESVMGKIDAWAVPTSGWSQEYTNWAFENKTSQLTHDDEESKEISWYNPFGAGLPTSTMEEISFTEEDLDELIDLLDNNKPIVMEFA